MTKRTHLRVASRDRGPFISVFEPILGVAHHSWWVPVSPFDSAQGDDYVKMDFILRWKDKKGHSNDKRGSVPVGQDPPPWRGPDDLKTKSQEYKTPDLQNYFPGAARHGGSRLPLYPPTALANTCRFRSR